MKQLFLIAALVCSLGTAVAQNDSTYQLSLNALFKNLNPANISSGLLLNKGNPIVNVDSMDGEGNLDSIDSENGESIYNGFYNSQVGNTTLLPEPEWVNNRIRFWTKQNKMPIVILDLNYQALKDSALINEWIGIDTNTLSFYDIPGQNDNPYYKENLFIAYCGISTYRSNFTNFVFDPALFFTNEVAEEGSYFMADFDDGLGMRRIQMGDEIPIVYDQSGMASVKIKFVKKVKQIWKDYKDQSRLFDYWEFGKWVVGTFKKSGTKSSNPLADAFGMDDIPLEQVISVDPIKQLENPDGNNETKAKGTLSIQYGYEKIGDNWVKRTCLKKPLVFVEGIDFGYKEKGWTGEQRVPGGFVKCGTVGYIDIARGKQWNVETERWEDYWKAIEQGPDALKSIRYAGYDVIYVDFWNGADYMENNAMVVVGALQWIEQSQCLEDIVVVGASMGGQVAKYALSYMEKNNLPHCVRTYNSFDSPQQGANIPISMQQLLKYYDGYIPNMHDTRRRKLNRIASKELLNLHSDVWGGNGQHQLRVDFMADLTYKLGGYPDLTRNIAIANGSSLGKVSPQLMLDGSPMQPGSKIAEIRTKSAVKILIPLVLMPLRIGWIASQIIKDGEGHMWALSKNTHSDWMGRSENNVVSYCNNNYKSHEFYTVSPTQFQYDNAPGGTHDAIKDFNLVPLDNKVSPLRGQNYTNQTCFIPTVSALDVFKWNSDNDKLYYDVYFNINPNKNLPFPSVYPFQAYYAPKYNQEHVFLDAKANGNVDWLLGQLANNEYALPNSLIGFYNFGNNFKNHLKTLNVSANGELNINKAGATETGTSNSLGNDNQSFKDNFEVITSPCGAQTVEASDGGKIIVGDATNSNRNGNLRIIMGSTLRANKLGKIIVNPNGSEIHIEKGSKLEIMDGGELHIKDGSTVVIEEGAELTYHWAAKIILEGPNSVLHIKGKLVVLDNAEFSISGNGSIKGYVKFTNLGVGKGTAAVEAVGKNATINLTGSGQNANPVVMVEGVILIPHSAINNSNYIAKVTIKNGDVLVGQEGKLQIGSQLDLQNATLYSATGNASTTGIETFGNIISADNLLFRNLGAGWVADNGTYNNRLTLTNSIFKNCGTGMQITKKGLSLQSVTFLYNTDGLILSQTDNNNEIGNCYFLKNTYSGITLSSNNKPDLTMVKNSKFILNENGILSNSQNLVLYCNIFSSNQFAIDATAGIVNLSPRKNIFSTLLGTMQNGGTCEFANNNTSIRISQTELYLEDGGCNFIQSGIAPYNFISGILANPTSASYISFTPFSFKAAGNYWQPNPGVSNLLTAGAPYSNLKLIVSMHSTSIPMEGTLLLSRNSSNCLKYSNNDKINNGTTDLVKDLSDKNNHAKLTSNVNLKDGILSIKIKGEEKENQINNYSISKTELVQIEIVDFSGKILFKGKSNVNDFNIPLQNCAEGIYLLKLKKGNKASVQQIFIY